MLILCLVMRKSSTVHIRSLLAKVCIYVVYAVTGKGEV